MVEQIGAVLLDTDSITADTTSSATDFIKRFIRIFNPSADLNFSKNDAASWHFIKNILTPRGFAENDAERINFAIWNQGWVLRHAPVIEGARALVQKLKRAHIPVFSATSRPDVKQVHKETTSWISQNFPEVQEIYMNPAESNLNGAQFKAEVLVRLAEQYGSAVLVEDYPGHAQGVLETINASGKNVDILIVLLPYALIEVPESLAKDPRVIVVKRGPNQNIKPALSLFNVAQS